MAILCKKLNSLHSEHISFPMKKPLRHHWNTYLETQCQVLKIFIAYKTSILIKTNTHKFTMQLDYTITLSQVVVK